MHKVHPAVSLKKGETNYMKNYLLASSLLGLICLFFHHTCQLATEEVDDDRNSQEIAPTENSNIKPQQQESQNPGLQSRFSLLNKEPFTKDVPEGYVQDHDALPN